MTEMIRDWSPLDSSKRFITVKFGDNSSVNPTVEAQITFVILKGYENEPDIAKVQYLTAHSKHGGIVRVKIDNPPILSGQKREILTLISYRETEPLCHKNYTLCILARGKKNDNECEKQYEKCAFIGLQNDTGEEILLFNDERMFKSCYYEARRLWEQSKIGEGLSFGMIKNEYNEYGRWYDSMIEKYKNQTSQDKTYERTELYDWFKKSFNLFLRLKHVNDVGAMEARLSEVKNNDYPESFYIDTKTFRSFKDKYDYRKIFVGSMKMNMGDNIYLDIRWDEVLNDVHRIDIIRKNIEIYKDPKIYPKLAPSKE